MLLKSSGALLGTAMIGHDGHRGGLYYLAVDPAHQGQGLGRRLMHEVEQWLRERGVPKLNLMVRNENDAVIGFYKALGYTTSYASASAKGWTERASRYAAAVIESAGGSAHVSRPAIRLSRK